MTIKKATIYVILAIIGTFVTLTICDVANSGGLGSDYAASGSVYVTITKNPHKEPHSWGVVNPLTGDDIVIGMTDEVDQTHFVGYYENQILSFWADGKNKRFYTGHGQSNNETEKFVINGVQFSIEASGDITPVLASAEVDNCVLPDAEYIPVKLEYLEYFHGVSTEAPWVLRIRMSGPEIDWNLFTDGTLTSEVIINDECSTAYNISEEIHYFNCRDGSIYCSGKPGKDFEGYRMSDTLPNIGTYAGKLRVETQYGVNRHYTYINNPDDHADLVGTLVNVKINLYQDGELIQSYEGNRIMTTRDKRL